MELSIVVPLLLMMMMGIIEFGVLYYNKQVLTNASREGARAGIARLNESEIITISQNYCNKRLIRDGSDVLPSVTVTGALGTFGSNLTVELNYTYAFMFPKLLKMSPTLPIGAITTMKMER